MAATSGESERLDEVPQLPLEKSENKEQGEREPSTVEPRTTPKDSGQDREHLGAGI